MERLGVIGGTGLIDMTLGKQLEAHGLTLVQRDAVMVETPYGEVPLTCIQLAHGDVKKELNFPATPSQRWRTKPPATYDRAPSQHARSV